MKNEATVISSQIEDCSADLKSSLFEVFRAYQAEVMAEQLQLGRVSVRRRFRVKNSYKPLQRLC